VELIQKLSILGGKLKLHVGNDDVLVITKEKIMNTSTTKYLLDNIDPRCESYKQFSVVAAFTSIVCLALSIFFGWYGKTYHEPPDDGAYLFFSIITFFGFIITAVKAYRSKINIVCFNSHDGRRLFSILGSQPSSDEVTRFCEALAKRIEKIRYNGEISYERMAVILKTHVEFLYEQNVLNEIEVKTAIDRISSKTRFSVLNFADNESV
jgi:hypothetical protein